MVIILVLSLSASVIFLCTNIANKLKFKYPIVSCPNIEKHFGVVDKK